MGIDKAAPDTDEKPRVFYGYVVVSASFFILAILDGTMFSFGVFLKPLAAEFGWTRAAISGAYSLLLFVIGFLFMVTGRLNDRFGPRVVMTVCGFLLGLGYLLMSCVSAIWQLYLFYGVIVAMGMSGGLVPLSSTIAQWFVRRRGIMTGIAISGIGAGTIIMPPLASQLITSYGWRTCYLIMGIAALVLLMLAAQFLRRDPSQKGQVPYGCGEAGMKTPNIENDGLSLRQSIRTGQFWMLGFMFFGFGFALFLIIAHIVSHATDLGIAVEIAAGILAVIGVLSIAGMLSIGRASDKIGNKRSLIICFILLAVVFLWLLVARDLWMLYVFAIFFGLAYGGLIVLMSPTAAELFGLKSHGVVLGAITFIHCIGCALGALIGGWVFDVTASYDLAFIVCAILSVLALVVTVLLKPVKRESLTGAGTMKT